MISNHSKRRKIAGNAPAQATTCPMYNLFPAGVLKEIANFLEAPSRVLFAIAVEPPSSRSPYDKILARCQPRKLSRSPITRNLDWRTLDFSDIEKMKESTYLNHANTTIGKEVNCSECLGQEDDKYPITANGGK